MNYSEFRQKIKSAFLVCEKLDLSTWDRFPHRTSLSTNEKFKSVALASKSRYEEIYKIGLTQKHYNFILRDFSYLQFSASQVGVHCGFLRYAYYPNPYQASDELEQLLEQFADDPELVDVATQYYDDADIEINKPLIRYDFEQQSYREYAHPAGHLHVGTTQSCRIPVAKKLSPYVFMLFILKHFYNEYWQRFNAQCLQDHLQTLDTDYIAACDELELLPDHLFNENERNQPHLA